MTFPLEPRDSSHIAASGYGAQTGDLHIRFKSGGHWIYHNVPQTVADKLHDSESLGTVFMREIRDRFRSTVKTPRPGVPVLGKPHIRLKGGK